MAFSMTSKFDDLEFDDLKAPNDSLHVPSGLR